MTPDQEQAQRSALIGHLLADHDATGAYGFPSTRQLKVHHQAAHGSPLHGALQQAQATHRHHELDAWNR